MVRTKVRRWVLGRFRPPEGLGQAQVEGGGWAIPKEAQMLKQFKSSFVSNLTESQGYFHFKIGGCTATPPPTPAPVSC